MKKGLFILSLILSICFSVSAEKQDTVQIGTYVISLHDINFHDKEYTMRFWLWMKYKNPKLDFVNTVEVPNAKEIEKPDFFSDTVSAEQWELMKMKCKMKQAWKVENYPFDRQDLLVSIENSKYDSRSLHFAVDSTGKHYDPELTVDGWKITDFKIYTGQKTYLTDFGDRTVGKPESVYDTFNISMRLERSTWGLFFKLFIGMYIAFLIAAVSFLIDPEYVEPRFGLPVGGLFAAVGNKYIIDSILPESNSFTLVDSLHAVTFIFIFFIITESSIALIFEKKGWDRASGLIRRFGGIVIISSYFVINIVLIIRAILG